MWALWPKSESFITNSVFPPTEGEYTFILQELKHDNGIQPVSNLQTISMRVQEEPQHYGISSTTHIQLEFFIVKLWVLKQISTFIVCVKKSSLWFWILW